MTLYQLKVHLQTFLSIPITQKCQIFGLWHSCRKWAIFCFTTQNLCFLRLKWLKPLFWIADERINLNFRNAFNSLVPAILGYLLWFRNMTLLLDWLCSYNNNNNDNNNTYLLQLVCYPVAVIILHVYKIWNWLLLNLSREGYMRSM